MIRGIILVRQPYFVNLWKLNAVNAVLQITKKLSQLEQYPFISLVSFSSSFAPLSGGRETFERRNDLAVVARNLFFVL